MTEHAVIDGRLVQLGPEVIYVEPEVIDQWKTLGKECSRQQFRLYIRTALILSTASIATLLLLMIAVVSGIISETEEELKLFTAILGALVLVYMLIFWATMRFWVSPKQEDLERKLIRARLEMLRVSTGRDYIVSNIGTPDCHRGKSGVLFPLPDTGIPLTNKGDTP
ncbi:MAG TPA: hypothetical protein VGP13_04435 [Candidatus Paceibacterota bacterium]|jgi:membrane-anchored glycerophosphoryl diester phosphodiesterase (GDPDase)|nr:hypothetical protein [Candidatus Paceibacterota bacterium]